MGRCRAHQPFPKEVFLFTVMAKRFIDTDLFKKKFIRDLDGTYKLLWIYIINDCNHAGIWEPDFEVASIRIGVTVYEDQALKKFGDKVVQINGGEKWFFPSFIQFQYPSGLNPKNNAHISVISILERYKIKDLTSPSLDPNLGAMVMDKDMVKVKSMDKEKVKEEVKFQSLNTSYPFKNFVKTYDKKVGDLLYLESTWIRMSEVERKEITQTLPKFIESKPDKKYRPNMKTYLEERMWTDEIILPEKKKDKYEKFRKEFG